MEEAGQVGSYTGLLSDPEIWVAVAFCIFVILFGRKIWTTVTALLDRRLDAVRAELDEAARLRQEAEAMLAEASRQRDQALAEAKSMRQNAHQEAMRLTKITEQDVEATAKRRERMAMDRIAAAEQAAVAEIRRTAATVATRAATEVIGMTMTVNADSALIDQSIARMPAIFKAQRAAA